MLFRIHRGCAYANFSSLVPNERIASSASSLMGWSHIWRIPITSGKDIFTRTALPFSVLGVYLGGCVSRRLFHLERICGVVNFGSDNGPRLCLKCQCCRDVIRNRKKTTNSMMVGVQVEAV